MTVLLTVLTGIFLPVVAQKNYYVMVGAFSAEGNATELTTHLPSMNLDTAYAMQDQDKTMHLYLLKTSSQDIALAKALELQNAVDHQRMEAGLENGEYESMEVSNRPEGKTITLKKGIGHFAGAVGTEDASSAQALEGNAAGSSSGAPLRPKGQLFKFSIVNDKGSLIPGKVHHIDFEREHEVAAYTANMYADILNPGRDKEMAMVCGLFGYKEVEKFVNYNNPSEIEGVYKDENGAWVIPYELERLEKGDVSVMYNVAFHKDAVVMLPNSQSDLDQLVTMMNENPDLEITIHGHCNGKYSRKIIATDDNAGLFDMSAAKEINGSAKLLSSLRADAVRGYLMKNGIDEKRVKTFAWGGNYMLVDQDSPNAKLNDRIEIEIRKD